MEINRSVEKRDRKAFTIGDWQVSPLEGVLRLGGRVARLEPKAMEVLVYLASRPGEVVTREELERDVWHGALVGYDAVTSTIIKLRKALQDDARNPQFIATIPKRGYKLLAPVSFGAVGQDSEQASHSSRGPVEASQTGGQQGRAPGPRNRYRVIIGVSAGLFAAGLLGLWFLTPFYPDTDAPASDGKSLARPSIVVLPFENLGGDSREEFLADGMTEDIITDLSKLSNLLVIASNTSSQYKGTQLQPIQIGKELNVTFLLQGSLRRIGDAIRVNAQLVDTRTGFNAWAQRYDRKLAEVFAVQDEVTRRIVESLAIEITDKEERRLTRRATEDLRAYDLFHEGQRFFQMRTRSSYDQAARMYRQAIEVDPGYGRAYGALAVTLASKFRDGWTDSPMETLERALKLAKKAVALDDSTPQTHWALGFVHLFRKEIDEAKNAATQSITVAPNYADGYALLAWIKAWSGDAKEAIAIITRGMRRNPYYRAEYLMVNGLAHYALGEYEAAIASLERGHERNEYHFVGKLLLTASYVRAGRQDDAEWLAAQLQVLSPAVTITDLKKTLPVDRAEFKKVLFEDLRKAGIPD